MLGWIALLEVAEQVRRTDQDDRPEEEVEHGDGEKRRPQEGARRP